MIPSVTGSPNGNTHFYTGHERDTLPSGFNQDYMHFRYYGSSMGRFFKPDNISDGAAANPQGWNLYTYVKGNPVNFSDPTGHMATRPGGVVADVGAVQQLWEMLMRFGSKLLWADKAGNKSGNGGKKDPKQLLEVKGPLGDYSFQVNSRYMSAKTTPQGGFSPGNLGENLRRIESNAQNLPGIGSTHAGLMKGLNYQLTFTPCAFTGGLVAMAYDNRISFYAYFGTGGGVAGPFPSFSINKETAFILGSRSMDIKGPGGQVGASGTLYLPPGGWGLSFGVDGMGGQGYGGVCLSTGLSAGALYEGHAMFTLTSQPIAVIDRETQPFLYYSVLVEMALW